jgi:hypothetical protein
MLRVGVNDEGDKFGCLDWPGLSGQRVAVGAERFGFAPERLIGPSFGIAGCEPAGMTADVWLVALA